MPAEEAAAAATTAARDVRPESSRRRRWPPLQCLAPGPLVSRTRARAEEQGRREARLGSASRALSGAAVLVGPGAGDCSSCPPSWAGPVRRRGASGIRNEGRVSWGIPSQRTFSPDPWCPAPRPWPLRCRCVGPRGGRAAVAARGRERRGRWAPSRSAGGTSPAGGGGERDASLLLATGIPIRAGKGRDGTQGQVCIF